MQNLELKLCSLTEPKSVPNLKIATRMAVILKVTNSVIMCIYKKESRDQTWLNIPAKFRQERR